MDGPSRGAWGRALAELHAVLPETEPRELAKELFAIGETVDGAAKLRRALADPSRDAWPKRDLAKRLFSGKVSAPAMKVLEAAVSGRWASDRDLVDCLERLGFDAVFFAAQADGHLDDVQHELFRFERLVTATPEINQLLARRDVPGKDKAAFIERLLSGKVLPDTLWLAQRPALHPRARKYSATIWRQLSIAARRRDSITAVVTTAVPLSDEETNRLASGLAKIYGHQVFVATAVDESVIGGVHVRIGDEVVDGTVLRRLEDARRTMGA